MSIVSREFHLINRPTGLPTQHDFQLVEHPLDAPARGQLLVQNQWLSVDPYMRGRMNGHEGYIPSFPLNGPMDGAAVGIVLESGDDQFRSGDIVSHFGGWRDVALIEASSANKIQPIDLLKSQLGAYLGPLGFPGLAAYAGLLKLDDPKPGETVFVSAAGGAVGSLVVQLAKIRGSRVIASAGSDEKLQWLREKAGADATINYKTVPDLSAALRAAAPEGIDIYFDNVGSTHLEAALEVANRFARFILCGMIEQYNATPTGPQNFFMAIEKSIRLEGFISTDHLDIWDQFQTDMERWISEGRIHWQETVVRGLDQAPSAFLDLFSGKNNGKMLVDLTGN